MATISQWNPFGVSLNITATAGTITRTSATQFTVVINASWKCYWSATNTNYGMKVTSGGKTIYIPKYDGDAHSSGSGTLTGTYSISGNGAQTKSITVSFVNYKDDVTSSATKNITLDVNVPAWTSYTVRYDANGGAGAPSTQTKWKDQALTLSDKTPTRTGHSFNKWNTASGGTGTSYSPGGSYTANAGATLYAQWKINTYKVTYDANCGVLGSVTSQSKNYGQTLKLTGTATRTNYNFKGWATSSTASTATYETGDSYTSNASVTLYAVWELAYVKPRIDKLSVVRCDYEGNITDEGTFARVKFDWVCDKEISNIDITVHDANGDLVGEYYPMMEDDAPTGTSGTFTYQIGDLVGDTENGDYSGSLSVDSTYVVNIYVSDYPAGGTYENSTFKRSVTLNGLLFPIDVLVGGKGVSFGKPAEIENYADFAYDICLNNNLAVAGRDLDGNIKEAFQPVNQYGNTIVGWGNYSMQSGDTNVYGNVVNLRSNNGVKVADDNGFFVNGCQVGVNKVLWSGTYYMGDTQTATLSSAITSQANGVILVWSEYDIEGKEAVNANFNTSFVPKQFVTSHSSKGIGLVVTSATLNVVATKYVYISDTSISGYEKNNSSSYVANSGITATPNKFVLRYVIGV